MRDDIVPVSAGAEPELHKPGLIESCAMCQDISSAPERPYKHEGAATENMLVFGLLIFGLLNSVVCRLAQPVFCYLLRREVCGVKLRRTDLVMIATWLFLRVAAGHFSLNCLACSGPPPEILLIAF